MTDENNTSQGDEWDRLRNAPGSSDGTSLPPELFGEEATERSVNGESDEPETSKADPRDELTTIHKAIPAEGIGRHSRTGDKSAKDPFHSARAGSSFRRRSLLPTRRALIVVFLVSLLAAALIIDERQSPTQQLTEPNPVVGAAPAAATSSAWYCPMALSSKETPSASTIVILNPNDSTLTGSATYFPQGGASVEVPVSVPARTRISLSPGDTVDASFAATLVRFDGGGAAVEHSIASPHGVAYAPCATQASSRWYFAEGATQANSALHLGLFNPFFEDAIVDITFNTNDGIVEPDEFQGVVVAGRSFTSLNVSDRVRRRDWIATTISARSGRIVSSQFQSGLHNGVLGTGFTLGAAAPRGVWYLPDGVNMPGFTDQLTLFNPNDRESLAVVELLTDKGTVTPFQLHIPANARVPLNIDKEERVPKDANYGAVVRVTNGVDIVVQRTATVTEPYPTRGAFSHIADTDLAKRWIVPFNETRDPVDDWVYVMNASGSPATVNVTGVLPNSQPLSSSGTVQAGRRLLIHVDEFAPDASNPGLIIESDQPVVVGRTLYTNPGVGFNSTMVIPVR